MNKAIFIDKDGTLIRNIPYNVNPEYVVLEGGVREALRKFKQHHYLLIVISNQSGIAKGFFNERDLEPVKQKIQRLFHSENIQIDEFYFCPHHPDGVITEYATACPCRKPEPGMILEAAVDFNIDLTSSWMIGDILHDIEAGNRAGCKTILIDNGNETEWITNEMRWPSYIVNTMEEAAAIILEGRRDVEPQYQFSANHRPVRY
jgi:D-glycero-D-manno-heptose 1,7-bisphosphate phosphatase